jgi:hypothetical protein
VLDGLTETAHNPRQIRLASAVLSACAGSGASTEPPDAVAFFMFTENPKPTPTRAGRNVVAARVRKRAGRRDAALGGHLLVHAVLAQLVELPQFYSWTGAGSIPCTRRFKSWQQAARFDLRAFVSRGASSRLHATSSLLDATPHLLPASRGSRTRPRRASRGLLPRRCSRDIGGADTPGPARKGCPKGR